MANNVNEPERNTMSEDRMSRVTRIYLPVCAITLLAGVLRAFSVAKPVSGDEMTVYLYFLRGGWHSIFQAWSDPFPPFLIDVANHPVNNILTYLSINTFETVTQWSLRLPAFLSGCLTVPLVYALGYRCTRSRNMALLSALGLALANGHVQWSGISRGYSTMIMFETALLLCLVMFQERRTVLIAIGAVLSGILMVYSQFVSLAVLAGIVVSIPIQSLMVKSDDRLRHFGFNMLLLFLIGIGTSIIYLPQFSVVDTLTSVVRDGALPAETFGQIPGFDGEDVPRKSSNPSWAQGKSVV